MSRRGLQFSSVRTEGGLLPQDVLARIQAGDKNLPGLTAESYHLGSHERIGEAVNRSWSRLTGAWSSLQEALAKEPESGTATAVTRDRWLLPLFEELRYGRLPKGQAIEVEGKSYAVSHSWHRSPIHLLGAGVDLDRRQAGISGAAKASPHGLVQEFLNRSDGHRWGFVSNGLRLRVLRDHHSLTRQAFVEFDLESIMDGEQYSEFLLLWMVCHQSRVEADKPEECWLERWFETSRDEGVRALDKLRGGVEKAIESFGTGFLAHRANVKLRNALESGELDKQEYYRQILRLIYRLIFLFVAEERDALLDPQASEEAKNRYLHFYASRRLRDLADKRRGGPHADLWQGLCLVMSKLDDGYADLGLPALGSRLWGPTACPWLMDAECSNEQLLDAVRDISSIEEGRTRYPVNWRNIGADELGSIYESLLELHPRINKEAATFVLETAAGHERKRTGSYYTPTELVDCLLDSALDPVIDEACKNPNPETAILDLKVCDPACGSGHFLVAAARRIAKRLAAVRAGEDEPSPREVQRALRNVVGRCVYGVDVNPMAVELCKVSLWMEAIEPGRPLSFLDSHIQCGNALLGATPALMARGIPDEAFSPIYGDHKTVASALKKQNKRERKALASGQKTMLAAFDAAASRDVVTVIEQTRALEASGADDIKALRVKQERWENLTRSPEFKDAWFRADAWCASFVWPKQSAELASCAITQGRWQRITRETTTVPSATRKVVRDLARHYALFHWHLAFPQVFAGVSNDIAADDTAGWIGGFDALLGNPPWDEIQFEETAWFSSREPGIATAPNATVRQRMIQALANTNRELFAEYEVAARITDGIKVLVRKSGLYPAGARGKLNTYVLFTEQGARVVCQRGRIGYIVPTGLATDKNTAYLFECLMSTGRIRSLFDFVNEKLLFPTVRPHQHFCLLTLGSERRSPDTTATFGAFMADPSGLNDADRTYALTWREVCELSEGSGALPLFPTVKHAHVFRQLAGKFPELGSQNGEGDWRPSYQQGTFNTASASDVFRTETQLREAGFRFQPLLATGSTAYVPLFDAKMARQYSWRAASVGFSGHQFRKISKDASTDDELGDPAFVPKSAYWVPKDEADTRLGSWPHDWLLGFKDVTGTTSTRMAAFAIIPRMGVAHKFPLLKIDDSAAGHGVLLAWLNSLLVEFVLRQRMQGVSLTWHLLSQIPTPPRPFVQNATAWNSSQSVADWMCQRVVELSATDWPLVSFSEALSFGNRPFRYEPERRLQLRCEIDAGWFLLAGLSREDAVFVLDYLEKVRASDERQFGTFRSKELVLKALDAMTHAADRGLDYHSLLDPPPADTRVAHAASSRPEWLRTQTTARIDVSAIPAAIPALDPDQEAAVCIWALLYAANGSISRTELARAFVLRSQPSLLSRIAPPELQATAGAWASRVATRSINAGALAAALTLLTNRDGIRLTTNASGQSLIATSPHTPPEDQIDDWFRFEARLVLRVLAAVPPARMPDIDATIPDADRVIVMGAT